MSRLILLLLLVPFLMAQERVGAPAIIDWNPGVSGTTDAGLDEAIAACPSSSKCIIRQRCNATYTVTHDFTATQRAVVIDGYDDIEIRGCPGSPIAFSGDTGSQSAPTFIDIVDSDRVAIRFLQINWTETCSSGCTGNNGVLITSRQGVNSLLIEGNELTINNPASFDDDKAYRGIWVTTSTAGTDRPTDIRILNNIIHASTRGIETKQDAGQILIQGNMIDFDGASADADSDPFFGIIARGYGTVIQGNVIDMRNTIVDPNTFNCIGLGNDAGTLNEEAVTSGMVVANNACIGIGGSARAVHIQGMNGAVISGNYFQAGSCSTATDQSCYEDRECPGSETCEPDDVDGVRLDADSGDNQNMNRGNLITGNSFGCGANNDGGWIDDEAQAPLSIEDQGGTDPNENENNLFIGNVMCLNDSGDDGIAATTPGIRDQNTFANNVVWQP